MNILNMVYTIRFFSSSKCSLFRNSNVFGSCIIHILFTGCAKIKKVIPAPKVNSILYTYFWPTLYVPCIVQNFVIFDLRMDNVTILISVY